MSANIPCNMQAMPEMMAEMVDQTNSDIHTVSGCQAMNADMSSAHNDMTTSNCDMSGNGSCSTASTLPFISINKLVIPSSGRSTAVLYSPTSLPEQHPESLYRPPLIA